MGRHAAGRYEAVVNHVDNDREGAAKVSNRQAKVMNPVEIPALDALDLLVVVDNESNTLHLADAAEWYTVTQYQ
jgi:hypothetical protein